MRNVYIDRLRGVSILLVLFGHSLRYFSSWAQDFPVWITHQIVTSAYYGVSVFFVISGYLITSKFVRPGDDRIHLDLRKFYVQRIGRIIPPLSLLIVVSFSLAVYYGAAVDVAKIISGLTCILRLDFFAAAKLIPHTESSYDALWSLAVEEAFYVFLPLVCLLIVTKSRFVFALVAAFIGGFLYRFEYDDIYSFFGTFDQLALGGILAVFASRLRQAIGVTYSPLLRWIGLAGIFAVCATTDPTEATGWVSLVALSAALYIVGAPHRDERSTLPLRILESFGAISYEIYLFHLMIFWWFGAWAFQLQTPLQILAADFVRLYPHVGASQPIYASTMNCGLLLAGCAVIYLIGLTIAKLFSEPMNQAIRIRMIDKTNRSAPVSHADNAAIAPLVRLTLNDT